MKTTELKIKLYAPILITNEAFQWCRNPRIVSGHHTSTDTWWSVTWTTRRAERAVRTATITTWIHSHFCCLQQSRYVTTRRRMWWKTQLVAFRHSGDDFVSKCHHFFRQIGAACDILWKELSEKTCTLFYTIFTNHISLTIKPFIFISWFTDFF